MGRILIHLFQMLKLCIPKAPLKALVIERTWVTCVINYQSQITVELCYIVGMPIMPTIKANKGLKEEQPNLKYECIAACFLFLLLQQMNECFLQLPQKQGQRHSNHLKMWQKSNFLWHWCNLSASPNVAASKCIRPPFRHHQDFLNFDSTKYSYSSDDDGTQAIISYLPLIPTLELGLGP